MNQTHYDILRAGVSKWDAWRKEHPDVRPDLKGADLSEACLRGADLMGADLTHADLSGADLTGAALWGALGNGREVCSYTFRECMVTWTATHIYIENQAKTIDAWFTITDEDLDEMPSLVRKGWRKWEPVLRALIASKQAER